VRIDREEVRARIDAGVREFARAGQCRPHAGETTADHE
jgi:hypothetical protein